MRKRPWIVKLECGEFAILCLTEAEIKSGFAVACGRIVEAVALDCGTAHAYMKQGAAGLSGFAEYLALELGAH